MSGATSEWPAWLRRRTAVEVLGEPGIVFPWIAIGLAFLVMVFVGVWNAQHYPVGLGYDATEHLAYSDTIIHHGHLPTAAESAEYRSRPGYYVVAGVAAWLGEQVGASADSYRGAQYLNVLLVLGTAAILLSLARAVAPRRPVVWAASLAFFAFLPVVAKTEPMFHPETLNMFCSALALRLAVALAQRRRIELRVVAPLVIALGAGFVVRSSTVFTLVALAIGLTWVLLSPGIRPHLSRRTVVGVALVLCVAVPAAWILAGGTPDLALGLLHPGTRTATDTRSNFGHLALGDVFRVPFRPNFVNAAIPVTYTEIWGDWIGAFSWSSYSVAPWPPALTLMRDQNEIGVLPTLLALAGLLILALRALRERRELAVVVALPVVALAGYLYRSYQFLSSDGDLLKASYVLTTAPVWALCFGVAFAGLGRFRLARVGVAVCLVVFGVLELRFMLYGIRDHHPIF
ncbi:MAG: hypothetical protein ACJ76I_14065 [Gaiellaceae bacterium]